VRRCGKLLRNWLTDDCDDDSDWDKVQHTRAAGPPSGGIHELLARCW
jgi:hypothetical protein